MIGSAVLVGAALMAFAGILVVDKNQASIEPPYNSFGPKTVVFILSTVSYTKRLVLATSIRIFDDNLYL